MIEKANTDFSSKETADMMGRIHDISRILLGVGAGTNVVPDEEQKVQGRNSFFLGASFLNFHLEGGQPILNIVDSIYRLFVFKKKLDLYNIISLHRMPWWCEVSSRIMKIDEELHKVYGKDYGMRKFMKGKDGGVKNCIDLTVIPTGLMKEVFIIICEVAERFIENRIMALLIYHTLCDSEFLREQYIDDSDYSIKLVGVAKNEKSFLSAMKDYLGMGQDDCTLKQHILLQLDDIDNKIKGNKSVQILREMMKPVDRLPELLKTSSVRLKNVFEMIKSVLKAVPLGQQQEDMSK